MRGSLLQNNPDEVRSKAASNTLPLRATSKYHGISSQNTVEDIAFGTEYFDIEVLEPSR